MEYRPRHASRALEQLRKLHRMDFVVHYAHALLARAISGPAPIKSPFLADIRRNGYCIIMDVDGSGFAPCFAEMDATIAAHGEHYTPARYLNQTGYLGIQHAFSNLTHLEEPSGAALAAIGNFLESSGIGDLFRSLYRSPFGVCNVRVWRYRKEAGPTARRFEAHMDGLPPFSWKLMFFRGAVTATGGCLEIVNDQDEVIDRVTGENALVIFDSNNVRHGSSAPQSGHRDTVELTIMPQIGRVPQIVAGGCQAGYPVNPFRRWHRPADPPIIVSV